MAQRKAVLALVCAVALGSTLLHGVAARTFEGTVGSRPGGWVDTGLDLVPGHVIDISASGSIRFDSAGRRADPDGLPDGDLQPGSMSLLVPALRPHTLIARIGGDASLHDLTGFLVGSDYAATVQTGGRLFLGFNDGYVRTDRGGLNGGGVGDNSGSYAVTITTTAPPSGIPVYDRWTAKAPMLFPRNLHIAESIGDYIYVGQGAAGGFQGEVDRYDPATDTWERRSMPSDAYVRASATVGGLLYAFGGNTHGGPLPTTDVYDPGVDVWTRLSNMPTPRNSPRAAAVAEHIYVLGGNGYGSNTGSVTFERYTPATDTWASMAPAPHPRAKHMMEAVGTKIYVFGGEPSGPSEELIDVYDAPSNSWTTLLVTARPRENGAAQSPAAGLFWLVDGPVQVRCSTSTSLIPRRRPGHLCRRC